MAGMLRIFQFPRFVMWLWRGKGEIGMGQGVRVIGPDRAQLHWDIVDLESQLPEDHRVRLVWAFVEGLDLSAFYERIKARLGGGAARHRSAGAAGGWLYATLEGIGSARAIDRLCRQHAAYRWLCGGAPVNHDLLAAFSRDNGARLDGLLTQSLTGLIAEQLITLEELAIDGTKVRAGAGRGSLSQRLQKIKTAVAERVAALKSELEQDPAEPERRRRKRACKQPRSGRNWSGGRSRSWPNWRRNGPSGPRGTPRRTRKRASPACRSAIPRRA
jgi:transposase